MVKSVLNVEDYTDGIYKCGLSDDTSGDTMSPEQVDLRFLGMLHRLIGSVILCLLSNNLQFHQV